MRRCIAISLVLLGLAAVSGPASAFIYVRGGNGRSGDLVAVWIKNGFELIVNLGPVESLGFGQIKSFAVPTQFGGDLSGAKFTALAVPDPSAVFDGLGVDPAPPQYNFAMTTLGDASVVTFDQISAAQSALDPPVLSQTWLNFLNSLPPAGGADVVENTSGQALITATYFAAYSVQLGFNGVDSIGSTITLSTAVPIDPDEIGADYQIPLYEVFQTLTEDNGNFDFGTQATELGVLTGDSGGSGSAILSFEEAPEPAAVGLGAAALVALGSLRRRRA